jgi:O-antigen/teichoic acid export membrane protein
MKDLWRKIVETSGARVYGLLAGLAVLVLTARVLGPEGRGIVAAVMSWVGLFSTLAYLSLGQVALHRAAQNEGLTWFPKTFGALLFLSLVLCGLCALIVLGLSWLTGGSVFGRLPPWALLLGFSILPFAIWEQYGSSLLTAINQLRLYNRAQVVGRTVGLIAVYAFVGLLGWGVLGAIGGNVLGQLAVSLTGFAVLWAYAGKKWLVDRHEVVSLLEDGAKLHLNAVAACLTSQSDILMLNYFWSKAQVGWYQLAQQLIAVMLLVPEAALVVLYARMAEVGPDRLWPEQKKMGFQLLGLMLGLCGLAYWVSPWIIPLVAGRKFAESVPVFRRLLPALPGMAFTTFTANQWIGRGLFLQAGLATLATGLLNVALNYLLIPRYGMMGAVAATLATYLGIDLAINLAMTAWCERRSRIAGMA